MHLFNKESVLLAPCSGESIPLSQVPDEVFSGGMLGDGIAIKPTEDEIRSPVRGRVVSIADTHHAYTILSEDGLDLLLHVGIDTVELKGECFHPAVAVGDTVEAGALLVRMDREEIQRRGYAVTTPLLITTMEQIRELIPTYGAVEGGKSVVLRYRKAT